MLYQRRTLKRLHEMYIWGEEALCVQGFTRLFRTISITSKDLEQLAIPPFLLASAALVLQKELKILIVHRHHSNRSPKRPPRI
jgi:hypothetical protein